MTQGQPFIVGIGGTTAPGSSTEQALALALKAAEDCGAQTRLFGQATLCALPHYGLDGSAEVQTLAASFVEAVRAADALIIASPGYHGTISGLVKNALDHLEPTARDARPYLDGLPVGLISTAYGWQAAVQTLATLRTICHGLRGWPTPMGAAVNCATAPFREGRSSDEKANEQISMIGTQVYSASVKWTR